jgi:hypothetical protein
MKSIGMPKTLPVARNLYESGRKPDSESGEPLVIM